jgi:acetylornithine deacetylase/succinyl-diaminopimelate desuccinylase-like protein
MWHLTLLSYGLAAGQPPVAQAADPSTTRALALVDGAERWAIAALSEIAAIPATSRQERRRAEAIAARMRTIGLKQVAVDSLANVTGTIPGGSGRAVYFVTMIDDLPAVDSARRRGYRPRRVGDQVTGAGVEIQSTVAAMLTAARALRAAGVTPKHDLVFAGVSQEETGLTGMAALYRRTRDRAVAYLEILGDGREIGYSAAGAIAWWKVVASGPEGHTAQGGLPNVNQAIARAVEAVFALPRPADDPEWAVNVGIIQSGQVVNHKPANGWFSIDARARNRESVEAVGRDVAAILERVGRETGIALTMTADFQSLGGQIAGARDSPLTAAALAAARSLGLSPTLTDRGCCNMRVAIAGGTPALGLDGDRGGDRGTMREWASITAMMRMARLVVILAGTVDRP